MSVFEITMLVCFGAAWPFSIYKSYRSRQVAGKSLLFLLVIFAGYLAGILHKVFYYYDAVVYLYALNGAMVLVDILLYFRNRLYHVRTSVVRTAVARTSVVRTSTERKTAATAEGHAARPEGVAKRNRPARQGERA